MVNQNRIFICQKCNYIFDFEKKLMIFFYVLLKCMFLIRTSFIINTRHRTTDCWIGYHSDDVLLASFIINDPSVMFWFVAKNSTANKKRFEFKKKRTKTRTTRAREQFISKAIIVKITHKSKKL